MTDADGKYRMGMALARGEGLSGMFAESYRT